MQTVHIVPSCSSISIADVFAHVVVNMSLSVYVRVHVCECACVHAHFVDGNVMGHFFCNLVIGESAGIL